VHQKQQAVPRSGHLPRQFKTHQSGQHEYGLCQVVATLPYAVDLPLEHMADKMIEKGPTNTLSACVPLVSSKTQGTLMMAFLFNNKNIESVRVCA